MSGDRRADLLGQLLRLEGSVDEILTELQGFSWDTDELVTLSSADLRSVLQRFERGELTVHQVATWADAIECRDDVGREAIAEPLLTQALFVLANPEINGALETEEADRLLGTLSRAARPCRTGGVESVSQFVFIERARLPSTERLQSSINDLGSEIQLASEVDLADHSGYWPATLSGASSGFEFFLGSAGDAFSGPFPEGLDGRDLVAEFVTHADMGELVCACYAAAALVLAAAGLALDVYDESGVLVGADRILEEGRAAEAYL